MQNTLAPGTRCICNLDCPTLRCTLQHCTVQLPNLPLTPQELDCFMLSLNLLPQLQQHIMQALLLLA